MLCNVKLSCYAACLFIVVGCYLTIISFIIYARHIVIIKRDYDHKEPVSSRVDIINHHKYGPNSTCLTIFDWMTAARIISESQIENASVALDISPENKCPILRNGDPLQSNVNILEHQIANPVLVDDDTGQIINCFSHVNRETECIDDKITSTNEDQISLLPWPSEAIDILDNSFYCKNVH